MKTRRTVEGTSKGGLTEEAYTLSNPPRARLLGAWLHESIGDGDYREYPIGEHADKVRVIFRFDDLTASGAAVVHEFTLDTTAAADLSYLNVEFWPGVHLYIEWSGSILQVDFMTHFSVMIGDVLLYEAF